MEVSGHVEAGEEAPQCFFCKRTPTKVMDAIFMVTRHTAHLGKRKLTAVIKRDARTKVCDEHATDLHRGIEGDVAALKKMYRDIQEKVKP